LKPDSLTISIRNLQRGIKIDMAKLTEPVEKAFRLCLQLHRGQASGLAKLRAVSVLLVSDRRMTALHRQFLGQDCPTDVLTFQHGEIVVSVETAMRNARRFGKSLSRELTLYIIHGLLHLHGFDDKDPSDARKMEKAQAKMLGMV
jgi:probable rRNA maturation factor